MKPVWFAVLLLTPLAPTGSALPSAPKDDVTDSENSAVQQAQLDAWIKQLGSPDFNLREEATVKLWEQGLAAEPVLKRAVDSADREIAFRAKKILDRFRLGIFADTDPKQIRLIRQFATASDRDKQNMIRGMLGEARIEEVMFLLDRETDPTLLRTMTLNAAAALDQLLPRLLDEGKDSLADEALVRFSITPASQFLFASYSLARGSEKRKQLMEMAEKAWGSEDPLRLSRQRLLNLLLEGQIEAARTELASMPDETEARGWANSICLAEGEYEKLLQQLSNDTPPESFDIAESGWLGQDLLLATWCARLTNDEAWQSVLDPIIDERVSNKQLASNQRIKLNLLTDRFTASIEEAAESDKLLGFALMCYQDQFTEAFERFGIGTTIEARQTWYGTLIQDLKKLEKENKGGRQQLTTDETRLRIAIEGAGWLATVGLREEASMYFDELYKAIPRRLASARMYQYRILDLEFRHQFNETFCEHVIALSGKARFEQIFGQVNPSARTDYIFWWWVYEAEYPEPLDRLLAIRRLLHAPYEDEVPAEQLERWLTTAADYYLSNAQNANKSSEPSVVLANTCFKNGMNDRGIDFLLKAVEKGLHANEKRASNDAIQSAMRLSKWHADREEWERSLEATQQWLELQEKLGTNNKRRNPLANWGQVHRIACLKHLGRSDEVAAELSQLASRQFSISQLSNLARLLDDEEMYDESRVLWKRLCYQPGKDFRPFAAYSYPALNALSGIVLDDSEQGDPRWVESLLGYMLADNNDWYLRGSINSLHPVVMLLNYREQVNQGYAHQALEDEQVAVAVRHLERGLKARPGNVDNVVAFADKLTELEANDELDALFDIARQLHVEVLNDYPDSAMHHNNLAWLCAKSYRNLEEARDHATQATDLRPAEDTYWDTLAEVEFQLGNLERATELARKCFVMDPLYPHYQTQLKKFEAALEKSGAEAP